MTTPNNAKSATFYRCESCDYITRYKSHYTEHLHTRKHLALSKKTTENNANPLKPLKKYFCERCNKVFNDRPGLWRHKKSCKQSDMIQTIINELVEVKKQNAELKELVTQRQNQVILSNNNNIERQEPIGFTTNITGDHNNIQNNTFNIQFLNNECKNAVNMNDFVNAFEVGVRQLDCIKDNGAIKAITTMFIETLNKYSLHERPIHCTDTKRLTMYVKDNDVWHTKEEGKQKLTKAIEDVQKIAMKSIPQWETHYKEKIKNNDSYSDKYMLLVKKTTNILTDDDNTKIIKTIAPNVKLSKNGEITES
jgi:uncharacterized C2H2 Zn-finger protein